MSPLRRRARRPWWLFPVVLAATPLLGSGCSPRPPVREIARDVTEAQTVRSPVRAFLADGSVVVFPEGMLLSHDSIWGAGTRYDIARNEVGRLESMPLEGVIGLEAFDPGATEPSQVLVGVAVAAVVTVGLVAVACSGDAKCFGSCPTIYSMEPGGEVLEAEAFSYSISPLLEGRDLDPLGARPDATGRVALEIRNEALETHFINHLELVEVTHAPGEAVVTDDHGRPAVLGPREMLHGVRDRAGRHLDATLSRADGRAYESPSERLASVTPEDFLDWIEVVVPPTGLDTVALTLRVRNSLLNTVLFYDFMLAQQGAGALDWLGEDIQRIGTAVELGSWYRRTMGLRLEVEEAGGALVEVARVADTGPIAWNHVAVRVPVRPDAPTRVRLSFLADAWRIDRLEMAREVRRAEGRRLPLSELLPSGGPDDPEARARLAAADEDYLVTSTGSWFTARFEAGTADAGVERTFLLSSQGYYTEWVRPEWIRSAGEPRPFRPSDDLLVDLMARWSEVKEPFEESFHATRIPVRTP